MPPTEASVVTRRRLGAELRRLREAAGRTMEDVALRLECSLAKVSRIETGHVSVRPLDVREILDLYGVTGARQRALLALARQARQHGWWHIYSDIIPEGYEFFISLEDEAAEILDYQPFLVPALLQTEEYMRAVMDVYGPSAALADHRVSLRRRRQALISGDSPPRLHVVVEEVVLRRPVGSSAVTARQLGHLADAAAQQHITVQVAPTSIGLHPAEGRAFTVLGFPSPIDPRVVYLEELNESHLVDDVDRVSRYMWTFEQLCARALSPADSTAMIVDLATANGKSP